MSARTTRAVRGERSGTGFADPLCRSGDNGRLAVQMHDFSVVSSLVTMELMLAIRTPPPSERAGGRFGTA